ncbi:probable DNA replication complex GINS protein PSF3 isoform X2 [Phoenix dactylifera]|uniref:Probable DNA replication complex GINS protein PSF3 isoform X2 n=1 Tax=Phoenix dactylifera TaxID=42345 RepID=A0A8B9A4D3_PHODC|nr:probable DNA replication complex GINS protein PSF3 isoform X2 [Phoenix dactylifera]
MPGYYDIDDIIMEEESISVVFQVGAHGVGLLDPGSETNSVEKGAKVDLPFWLAHELYLRQAVSISVPACFSQKVSDKSIGSFLHYAFTHRYKEILSKSHSASVATVPKFLTRLTKEESQLFEAARSSMLAFKKWRLGGSRLEKASILSRKRKTTMPTCPSTP